MGDIIVNIVSRTKLEKLRRKIGELRRKGGIKSSEVESLAKSLGRVLHPRGKEPTWVSKQFPSLRPLSIPHHSTDLNRYTAGNILDQLEEDLERFEERIKDFGEGGDDEQD